MKRGLIFACLGLALLLAGLPMIVNAAPAGDIYCQTRPERPDLCQDDPPPGGGGGDPTPQPTAVPIYPPSISGSVACAVPGTNGWCLGGAVLHLSASDPQGYATSLSGDLAGAAFACAGTNCSQALPTGTGSFHFQATSPASGLSSGLGSGSFASDPLPPTATLVISGTVGANGWYTAASTSATGADATSGLASTQVSVDGGGWQTSATLLDGTHSVVGRATDQAGNQTLTAAQVVRVDTTVPTLSAAVTSGTLVAGWFVTDVTLTASASDLTSGLAQTEFRLDGTAWQPGAQLTVSADGLHQVDFRTTDQAGLTTQRTLSFQIDQTPPTLAFAPSGTLGASGWFVGSVTLTITATDAQSGAALTEYRVNGGSWTTGTTLTLGEGRPSVEARATDRAGNQSSVSLVSTLNLQVDLTPPTLNILLSGTPGLAAWYVSAVTATAQVSDATSGLALTEFRLDGGVWQPGTMLTIATDGPHTVDFRTLDQAGNLSNASRAFKLDTTRPISVFTRPAEGTETKAAGTVAFAGSSSDALAGLATVEISVDDGLTWLPLPITGGAWSYGWDTLRLPDGLYPILVRASDRAGNRENTARVQIIIGNKPPKVEVQASWWLWESGALTVQPRQIDLRDVTLRISCAPYHPDVVLIYPGDQLPTALKWDRLCGNGAYAAESGDYPVTVTACDVFGHCAAATGVIKVPFIAPPVPTWTPTPQPSPTPAATATQLARSTTQPTAQPTLAPAPHPRPVPREPTPEPNWLAAALLIGLAGLVGLASAAIFDPRPRALRRLGKTLEKLAGAEKL
jgi:hypothetical protein